MDRRDFLKIAAASPLAAAACSSTARDFSRDFELDEVSVSSLQAGMESGKWSAHSITQLYLDRIRQLDRSGPELKAVIDLNPDALRIADALDA
jgi:amidase